MRKKAPWSATHLDWDRELCRQGCQEWIPWYVGVKGVNKGKMVYGCRIGEIPRKDNGQWQCRHRKPTKRTAKNGST